MPETRRRLLTSSEIVMRAVHSDVEHWLLMNNYRCPNCCCWFHHYRQSFDELYFHMTAQCEEPFVGVDWIRNGDKIDAPLADANSNYALKGLQANLDFNREIERRRRLLHYVYAACLVTGGGLGWLFWLFR